MKKENERKATIKAKLKMHPTKIKKGCEFFLNFLSKRKILDVLILFNVFSDYFLKK